MKYIYQIIVLSLLLLTFSGCGGSSYGLKVDKPISEVTSNKTKAYITFCRSSFVSGAYTSTLIEFIPETKTTKFIGIFTPGTKMIYEMDPGTHYFYMSGVGAPDMAIVTVSAENMYYMEIEPHIWLGFNFNPLKKYEIDLVSTLQNAKCTDDLLEKYNFSLTEDGKNVLLNQSIFYSYKYKIKIVCTGDSVSEIDDFDTIKSINNIDLYIPNEKAINHYKKIVTAEYISKVESRFNNISDKVRAKTELKIEDGVPLEP